MKIKQATSSTEFEIVRKLFREYEIMLGVALCFQGFEEELSTLPGKYSAPNGDLIVGLMDDIEVGCVAVRRLDETSCEMKRLYVKPEARGAGLGRELARRIIAISRTLGYEVMRLNTLSRLGPAIRLYETLGFRQIDPYYENPIDDVVYMELDLNGYPT